MKITIVVAMSKNRVIGIDGELPWHLPADLKRFRQITTGHPVIMGRKTFQSIHKRLKSPLPDRTNIVMSKNFDFRPAEDYVFVVQSFSEALKQARKAPGNDEVFIIGGESVFKLAMPYTNKISMTVIYEDFKGDVFFPELESSWRMIDFHLFMPDDKNLYRYAFIEYKRLK